MSEHVRKSHNKSLLLYHMVLPAKCWLEVFSEAVENTLKGVCKGIGERYEMNLLR